MVQLPEYWFIYLSISVTVIFGLILGIVSISDAMRKD